jgi:hypothetical protein
MTGKKKQEAQPVAEEVAEKKSEVSLLETQKRSQNHY